MTALLAEAARYRAARADGIEVSWVTPDAVERSLPLSGAWAVPFECGLPARLGLILERSRVDLGLCPVQVNLALSRSKLQTRLRCPDQSCASRRDPGRPGPEDIGP